MTVPYKETLGRTYRVGGKVSRHIYIGPSEEDEVAVTVGSVPTARYEAGLIVRRMNQPDAVAAVAAMMQMLAEKFSEFKPTLDGAIEAIKDWQANLIADDTEGVVWTEILNKIEENKEG